MTEDGAHSSKLLLADFDRDGDLNLVTNWDAIRINWNPGSGNFGMASQSLGTGYNDVIGFESGDFDGDGDLDLVAVVVGDGTYTFASQFTGRVVVYYNQGNGVMSGVNIAQTNAEFYTAVTLADINADGRMDLVLAAESDTTPARLIWLRGTGNATGTATAGFDAPATLLSSAQTGFHQVYGLASADLDEDGRPDLVCAAYSTTWALHWMRGTGTGVQAPAILVEGITSRQRYFAAPEPIGLADQDQDGDVDIIYNGGTRMLENRAIHRGAAVRVVEWTGTRPGGVADLACGDVNSDGRPDLIASDAAGKRLLWYAGTASGISAPWTVSTGTVSPISVEAADLNRDGRTDMVWTGGGQLTRSFNTAGTGFTWQDASVSPHSGTPGLVLADRDADGDTDILTMTSTGLRWFNNNNNAASWTGETVYGSSVVQSFAAEQFSIGGGPVEVATVDASLASLFEFASGNWISVRGVPVAGSTA